MEKKEEVGCRLVVRLCGNRGRNRAVDEAGGGCRAIWEPPP